MNKIEAVLNLIKDLEFSDQEKNELAQALTEKSVEPEPEREEQKIETIFELLYQDGTTSNHHRKDKSPVGIILEERERRFALYIGPLIGAEPQWGYNKDVLYKYAAQIPKVNGRPWRLIRSDDCKIMKKRLNDLQWQLRLLDKPRVRNAVMTADENDFLRNRDYQVWFVIDL